MRNGNGTRGAERRRSQRTPLVAPVVVAWRNGDGSAVQVRGFTNDVSLHGMLVRVDRGLRVGQIVVLSHPYAENQIPALVVRNGAPATNGWIPVALELVFPGAALRRRNYQLSHHAWASA